MRTRFILLVIVVLLFLYWHGLTSLNKQKNLNCQYHVAYAVCSPKSKTALPSFWDILKAGVRF